MINGNTNLILVEVEVEDYEVVVTDTDSCIATNTYSIFSGFIDTRDGVEYETRQVGIQIWTYESLKYDAVEGSCYFLCSDEYIDRTNGSRLYYWLNGTVA